MGVPVITPFVAASSVLVALLAGSYFVASRIKGLRERRFIIKATFATWVSVFVAALLTCFVPVVPWAGVLGFCLVFGLAFVCHHQRRIQREESPPA